MIWMEHASQRFLLRPTRIREDNQMMEPPLWDIWKIIDQTAAACSASFSLLSNEVLQRTRNSLRTGTSVTKKPPTTISRASSSDFMAPTNKDGLGRVMSNLKISEQVQGLKGSSDSHWDAFHQEQQSLHVPGEHLSSRGLRQTDSIQTSATSSECGEDNFTLYQGFAVPQRRPPSLDKGDSDATLPRQVSIAAIDDPLQLHSDSRKHKGSLFILLHFKHEI